LCQDISQSEFRINTRQSAGPAAKKRGLKTPKATRAQNSGNTTQRSKPRGAAHHSPMSRPQPQKNGCPLSLTAGGGHLWHQANLNKKR